MPCALRERLEGLYEKRDRESAYVFPDLARRYLIKSGSISYDFTSALRAYGVVSSSPAMAPRGDRRRVAEKSFHSIRHSFVSFARMDKRYTPDMVRDVVGHESEEVEHGYFTAPMEARAGLLEEVTSSVLDGAAA